MDHSQPHSWRFARTVLVAIGVVVLLAAPAGAGRRAFKRELVPTGADPNAKGRAKLVLRSDSNGRFDLMVHHLDPGSTFDVLVGGVNVGTLSTNGGGKGGARFRSRPRPHDALLGFDPRGRDVVVRNGDGQDVLQGTVPDDADASEVACCVPGHHGETECEDRTADECTQAGGTVSAAASCLPNPCTDAPAPQGVVCCIADSAEGALLHDEEGDDDNRQVECEDDLTQAECTARGGAVVEASSCEPNPCMATPPPSNVAPCCVPDDDGAECEVFTPERCVARGGTTASSISCEPDPCGGPHGGRHGEGD